MFAYLLIGVELAILYMTFWYVFVREPKPYKVREGMWGTYSDQPNAFAGNHFDPTLPIQKRSPEVIMLNESYYCDSRSKSQSSQYESADNLPRIKRNPSMRYGWIPADEYPPTASPRQVSGFSRKLRLNFRLT